MADFGFIGGAYIAPSRTQDDQECINWYPEHDPAKSEDNPATPGTEHGRGVLALYRTPGLDTQVTLAAAAEVRGVYTLPGGDTMLAVCGNKLYSVDLDFVATEVGELNSSAGIVGITDNNVSAYIVDGTDRYYYTWETDTFAVLPGSDGAFTGGTSCDILDNFIIYNRPNTNQWGCTDVGDVVSNSGNLGSLVGSNGNIVAVIADHGQALVIGEDFSERHRNAGTSPWPFAVIAGSSMQHGCAAPYSIARLGEGVAFLANDTRGRATVIIWGAAISTPQRISTYAIENAIQGYEDTSDAIGYSYSQAGHEFYVLTFPSANVTWCYDLSSGYWHKRAWRDSFNDYHRHRSNCAAAFGGQNIVGDFENGKLYEFSLSDYTDDGDPLPAVRRCRHITSDLNRQFFAWLQLQFQPGMGLQTGQGSDPEVILRFSYDGGFTFGNDHHVKIGKAGKYKHRAIKRRIGYARDLVIEAVLTDPVYGALVSAEMQFAPGSN